MEDAHRSARRGRARAALLAGLGIVAAVALAACSRGEEDRAEAGALVRKAAQDLTAAEKRDFVDAVLKLKRMPSPFEGYERFSYYDTFVKWHRDVFFCDQQTAHMGPNFLPWHRQFLLLFEQGLSKAAGKPISVPYWDWTDPKSTNAVFRDDLMGGDGNAEEGYAVTSGPFRQGEWRLNVLDQKVNDPLGLRFLVRQMGSFPGVEQLPTEAKVQHAVTRPVYDVVPFNDQSNPEQSFRNNLEGWRNEIGQKCEQGLIAPLTGPGASRHELHNGVHLWVGGLFGDRQGTMDLNTSPNDPVFFLHHANIDRIWQAWIEANGPVYEPVRGWQRPEQNLHQAMLPYKKIGERVTPASMLEIDKLDYRYDELPEIEAGRAGSDTADSPSASGLVGPATLGFSCALG